MDNELQIALLEILPHPVWVKDKKLRYVWVNPAFEELFGVTQEDILDNRHPVRQHDYSGTCHTEAFAAGRSAKRTASELKTLRSGMVSNASETVTNPEGVRRELSTEMHLLELDGDAYLLGFVHDVTETVTANDLVQAQSIELETLTSIDPLTGCLNRPTFFDRCTELPQGSSGHGVVIFAVNDLKAINNVHGHDAADDALTQIVAVVRDQLADEDLLSRLGGAEFAIVAANLDLDEATALATSISRAVDEMTVTTAIGPVTVSVSVGVTHTEATDRSDLDFALGAADRDLFLNKQQHQIRVLTL